MSKDPMKMQRMTPSSEAPAAREDSDHVVEPLLSVNHGHLTWGGFFLINDAEKDGAFLWAEV